MSAAQCPHCGHAIEGALLLSVYLPIRLMSEANAHEHWRMRARRSSEHHAAWKLHSLTVTEAQKKAAIQALEAGNLLVNIVRVEPRKLDSDNAAGCGKFLRDSIAIWLGIDDADTRVRWVVTQEKPGKRGARVEMRS